MPLVPLDPAPVCPGAFAALPFPLAGPFALPFAFAGMLLAADGLPGWGTLAWVTLAMVGARGIHRTYRSLPPALRPPFLTAPRPQQFTLELWDAQRGQRRANLADGEQEFIDVRFSPDGQWLASGSIDGTVKLWSLK